MGVEQAFFLTTVCTGTVFADGFIGGGLGVSFTAAFEVNDISVENIILSVCADPDIQIGHVFHRPLHVYNLQFYMSQVETLNI